MTVDRREEARPAGREGSRPPKPVFPWFRREPPEDAYEARLLLDDLRAKQRRGRLTVPAYVSGTLWFLTMGVVTGSWPPAGLLAAACALGGILSWLSRRDRRERIERMEERLEVGPAGGDERGGAE